MSPLDVNSWIEPLISGCLSAGLEGGTVWISCVAIMGVVGVAAFFTNLWDINKEKGILDNWKVRSISELSKKGRFDAGRLWRVFAQHLQACRIEIKPEQEANKDIAGILGSWEADSHSLSLLDERLLTITSFTRESNNVRILPSINAMHDLSLQGIESKWATKLLNICVACVLICGICGTLWGVHGHLHYNSIRISQLGECLLPSMWAVLVNILLVVLRNINISRLDHLVESLDILTVTQFIPALQQETPLGQTVNKFKAAVDKMPGDPRLEVISSTPSLLKGQRVLMATATGFTDAMLSLAGKLKNLFASFHQQQECLSRQTEMAGELDTLVSWISGKIQQLEQAAEVTKGSLLQLQEATSIGTFPELSTREHQAAILEARNSLTHISAAVSRVKTWQDTCHAMVDRLRQSASHCKDRIEQVNMSARGIQPMLDSIANLHENFTKLYGDQAYNIVKERTEECAECLRFTEESIRYSVALLQDALSKEYGYYAQDLESLQDSLSSGAAPLGSIIRNLRASRGSHHRQISDLTWIRRGKLAIVLLVILLAAAISVYFYWL